MEDDARFERRWKRKRQREELDRIGEPVKIPDGLARLAADLAREELEATGYHRHKRGEWRK